MSELATKLRSSVRLRITLAATLVFGVAFGAAGWLVMRSVKDRLEDQVRTEALAGVSAIAEQLEAGVPPDEVQWLDYQIGGVRVLDDSGAPVFAAGPGGGLVSTMGVTGQEQRIVSGRASANGDLLLVSTPTVVNNKPMTILAASPLAEVQRSVEALGDVLLVGTPLLIAALGVVTWLLVGRALRPVAAITSEVEEITHTTMHRRVPEPGSRDEIGRLARTMNEMLDRLENASERQRAFVSDASHELRTPVTSVQTALEVGIRSGDLERAARSALEANRRLQTVVTDLLDLARLDDTTAPAPKATTVDLEEVVLEEVAANGDPRIDTANVLGGRVSGNRDQLARLVRNLIDNATRHARERIAISVAADEGAGRVELAVTDDGPGIPAHERGRVFERFVRLDEDRGRSGGGSGLGLAIVRRIAEQHGGMVAATDAPGRGACLVVQLPRARVQASE
ncbi:MAG TPA: ATP-binding protein [Acidimicrobiales bacterium]|jgi:signal transduction histidine kinase|nr:ATP-binding protein [Acidimicrobiales bacterium]